jgi:hypothetical protein
MVSYEVGMFNQHKEQAFEKELLKNFGGHG